MNKNDKLVTAIDEFKKVADSSSIDIHNKKYSLIVKTKRLVLKIFDDFKDWFNTKC